MATGHDTLMQIHAHVLHSHSQRLVNTVITQRKAATSPSALNPRFGSSRSQTYPEKKEQFTQYRKLYRHIKALTDSMFCIGIHKDIKGLKDNQCKFKCWNHFKLCQT